MVLNRQQQICLSYLILLIVFWVLLQLQQTTNSFFNYTYSFLFGLIPLFGGAFGVMNSKEWGGRKSAVGKAVLLIGIGLVCWGCGEVIWSYYNFFLNEPAPYPSMADLGFAPSIFFYGIGAFYLSKASGARYGLRQKYAKLGVILTSIITAILAFHLLVNIARGGVLIPEGESALKIILDIVYPLGDFIALITSLIVSGLSIKYLGGRYRYDFYYIMIGLAIMFIGDVVFSYTTTLGTYYNGNFGDLILTFGLFFLTFGLLGFKLKN